MTGVAELVASAAAGLADPPPDPQDWRDAAIRAALVRAEAAGDDAAVLALADGYGALLCSIPLRGNGSRGPREVTLVPAGIAERRRRGAFATPPGLAAVLAGHALPDLPAGIPGHPLAVNDPACGTGALLRAALDRLVALGLDGATALRALYGVDLDPTAVALCRAALRAAARRHGVIISPDLQLGLDRQIVVGDALLGPAPSCPADSGLALAEVFAGVLDRAGGAVEPVTGWRGGFDAVLANPPWERLKVTRRDWAGTPPELLREQRADASRAVREGGRHPLTGVGEVNAYLPFVETCWRLLGPRGRAGIVVPAGVAADRSAARLVEALLAHDALESLHLLELSEPVFEGVSSRVGVAVLALRRGPHPVAELQPGGGAPVAIGAQIAVGLTDAAQPPGERAWRLDPALPRLVNPNSGTLPLFGSERDAAISVAAHRRWPVLVRRAPAAHQSSGPSKGALLDSPWQVQLVTPLHMTRDAPLFRTAPGPGLLPLWEAKHAGLLDHLGGARSGFRYWVPQDLVLERFGPLAERGWLAGYRNVTTTDSPRTLLPCALPVAGVGNSLPLISAPRLPLLLAALASLPVDYLVRGKHAGANLNFFKLEQVPLPAPGDYDRPAPWTGAQPLAGWMLDRLVAALRWDAGLAALAAELAAAGVAVPPGLGTGAGAGAGACVDVASGPGFDPQRRRLAMADLDAAHAILLGWERADLAHVLATFTALAAREQRDHGRFVTADAVLAAYDALTG